METGNRAHAATAAGDQAVEPVKRSNLQRLADVERQAAHMSATLNANWKPMAERVGKLEGIVLRLSTALDQVDQRLQAPAGRAPAAAGDQEEEEEELRPRVRELEHMVGTLTGETSRARLQIAALEQALAAVTARLDEVNARQQQRQTTRPHKARDMDGRLEAAPWVPRLRAAIQRTRLSTHELSKVFKVSPRTIQLWAGGWSAPSENNLTELEAWLTRVETAESHQIDRIRFEARQAANAKN